MPRVSVSAMKTLLHPNDKAEVLARLQSVHATTPRCWGKMSAHQMVCHLADGFRLYMSLKTAYPVPLPYPRIFLKWTALWAPIPWPKGIQNRARVGPAVRRHAPRRFRRRSARPAEPRRPLHAPAPRLPLAASSPFRQNVRRRVDAPGLPPHGPPPAPVRRVR